MEAINLSILFSSFIFLVLVIKLQGWRGKEEKGCKEFASRASSAADDREPPPARERVSPQRHDGPVVSLKLGEVTAVVISSRETMKEAIRTKDPACADGPDSGVLEIMFYNYNDIAFGAYSEYWRQMRKICILEMLSAKNVKSFGYIRAEEMDNLVKSVQSVASSEEAVNFTELIFMMTCSVTYRATFGKVLKGRETFIKSLKKMATISGGSRN